MHHIFQRLYGHFATALYHVYKAMEDNFDAQPQETGISRVWQGAPELCRAEALGKDLAYLGLDPTLSALFPATQEYVDSIHNAAKEDSALLLGHFYCRYFADLFGVSMLGYPTKVAVGLPEEYPAFYNFHEAVSAHRQEYIEGLYEALNEEGEKLCQDTQAAVVGETKKAFALNANLYTAVAETRVRVFADIQNCMAFPVKARQSCTTDNPKPATPPIKRANPPPKSAQEFKVKWSRTKKFYTEPVKALHRAKFGIKTLVLLVCWPRLCWLCLY